MKTIEISEYLFNELMKDKKRLDWLETQDCWIDIDGEYDIKPKYACGDGYKDTVREICDKHIGEVK
jgi:hypothetical protein